MQNLLISILRPLLELIYWIVPNYGWTVVIFTLVIRAILMPLDIKSRKSMKRMSNLKPQLDALSAKYANDKEKLQRKTAELYRKEKVNPMSGCLPLLIQFPLLFGMLWTMQAISSEHIVQIIQTLEAGGTPVLESWLWVKNVFCADTLFAAVIPISRDVMSLQATAHVSQEAVDAAKAFVNNAALYNPIMVEYGATVIDSIGNLMRAGTIPSWEFLQVLNNPNGYYILPVLAAGTQFLQTKLNPATEAPQQGTGSLNVFMKYFFPLFSLWICLSSSAAFAIYWLTANVIAILQNILIGKYLDRKEAKAKASEENA